MSGCDDMGSGGEGQMNQALIYVHQKGKWLEIFCAWVLLRRGYPDHMYWAQDLAQIVRLSLSTVEDKVWEGVIPKDCYVRRTVWRAAKKFCERNQPREQAVEDEVLAMFADETPGADPEQMLESAERILRIRKQLTDKERELFDYFLMNGREGGFEKIASELGIQNAAAARKRAERLKKRVVQLIKEGDTPPPNDHDTTLDFNLVGLSD